MNSAAAAHIGRLIAEQRKRTGITQDQLAATSSIDSSNIRAYENGRSMPSIHTLLRIATGLDVEPSALLRGLTLDLFGRPVEHTRGAEMLPVKAIEPGETKSRQARLAK